MEGLGFSENDLDPEIDFEPRQWVVLTEPYRIGTEATNIIALTPGISGEVVRVDKDHCVVEFPYGKLKKLGRFTIRKEDLIPFKENDLDPRD